MQVIEDLVNIKTTFCLRKESLHISGKLNSARLKPVSSVSELSMRLENIKLFP